MRAEFNLAPASADVPRVVADDLALDLVLQDPEIAKSVHLTCDERGRMWVIEFRQ